MIDVRALRECFEVGKVRQMQIDEIRQLYQALSPTGRTIVVCESNGHLTIDVPLIIAAKKFENGARPRKRKR